MSHYALTGLGIPFRIPRMQADFGIFVHIFALYGIFFRFVLTGGNMIDSQDELILTRLQQDGRRTNQQLASDVGMSNSACWRRVKSLEDAGIIQSYAAIVDRKAAGFATEAILHVSLDRHDAQFAQEFEKHVRTRAEVLDCFATTGDADYHLRVVVRDMDAYNHFLDEFMFRLPGVRHVRSNMVLKEIKTDISLPFGAGG